MREANASYPAWIPAFAGMTNAVVSTVLRLSKCHSCLTQFSRAGAKVLLDGCIDYANTQVSGIRFEQAVMVFFDPFFRLVDASRNDEARDAVIGYDEQSRLLFVVHVEIEDDAIRIISARKATNEERKHHDL